MNMNILQKTKKSVDRVLLVAGKSADAAILPAPTHSGTSVVRWGLVKGLAANGVAVGYYSASPYSWEKNKAKGSDIEAVLGADGFWFDKPGPQVTAESVAALDEVLALFRPDVVLAYGHESVLLVRSSRYLGPIGLMSTDLEFLPKLYKALHFLRFGSAEKRRATLFALPQTLRTIIGRRRAVMRCYPSADFIINHAAHHAEWHRRRHAMKTLYVPNPVEARYDSLPEKNFADPPRFLLLGGLAGAATQPGLAWFATKVYPKIEQDIVAGRLEVHLAGRSELRTPIIQRMRHVVQRGYIDDLDEEMGEVTAILVPTPIKLGARVRILEAFRYGVAVISHKANKAGMPEIEHNRNVLLASSGQEFADAMLRLAAHEEDAVRLGRMAFEDFSRELNSTVSARRILRFMEEEVMGECDEVI